MEKYEKVWDNRKEGNSMPTQKIVIRARSRGRKVRDKEHLKAQIRYPHLVAANKKKYNRKRLPKIEY